MSEEILWLEELLGFSLDGKRLDGKRSEHPTVASQGVFAEWLVRFRQQIILERLAHSEFRYVVFFWFCSNRSYPGRLSKRIRSSGASFVTGSGCESRSGATSKHLVNHGVPIPSPLAKSLLQCCGLFVFLPDKRYPLVFLQWSVEG